MRLKRSMLLSPFAKETDRNAKGVANSFRVELTVRRFRRSDREVTSESIAPSNSGGMDVMVVVSKPRCEAMIWSFRSQSSVISGRRSPPFQAAVWHLFVSVIGVVQKYIGPCRLIKLAESLDY